MTTPSEQSVRHKPQQKGMPPAPAVQKTDCPNCGRKGVVVFPVIRADQPDAVVRPLCCPGVMREVAPIVRQRSLLYPAECSGRHDFARTLLRDAKTLAASHSTWTGHSAIVFARGCRWSSIRLRGGIASSLLLRSCLRRPHNVPFGVPSDTRFRLAPMTPANCMPAAITRLAPDLILHSRSTPGRPDCSKVRQ